MTGFLNQIKEGGENLLKSSSDYEMTIRHQYDRICCLALKCEAIDYFRRINIQRKREVMFCEMS